MEQKDRYLIMLFLVVFIADFIIAFFRTLSVTLPGLNWYDSSWLFMFISLIFNPFLVFVASYLIGKKFDVRTNLRSVIIILMTGAILGNISYSIIFELIVFRHFSLMYFASRFLSMKYLYTFSLAFSALVMANFRHNDWFQKRGLCKNTVVSVLKLRFLYTRFHHIKSNKYENNCTNN